MTKSLKEPRKRVNIVSLQMIKEASTDVYRQTLQHSRRYVSVVRALH